MKRKYIFISLLILVLISVQFVSANDHADIEMIGDNGDNEQLGLAEDNDLSVDPTTETKSYTDLKTEIDDALDNDRDEITLEFNYQYNQGNSDPKTGINITKNLVINGNGATIDGASASSLFNISEGVLKIRRLMIGQTQK